MPNHYESLGINPSATESEIKKAYRTLSLKYHPDRNPSPEAKAKFQEFSEAYEVLSDPVKKQEYDDVLSGRRPANVVEIDETDLQNIFGMMFGFGQGQGHPGMPFGPGVHFFDPRAHIFKQMQLPPPIIKTVELTLQQIYSGCTISVEINKWKIEKSVSPGEPEKKTHITDTLSINIQPGTESNEAIVIQGIGNEADGQKGDVKLVFVVVSHPELERRGLDLWHKRTLSLKDALCGFTFELEHVNGKKIALTNLNSQTIVSPGYKKIIPGLGMIRNGVSGNLVIEFDVKFPETLTKEQIDAIANIL